MTNTEIIQAIRNEIERRRKIGGTLPFFYETREQKTGYESALIDIEFFLDTLESEKPVPKDLEEAAIQAAQFDMQDRQIMEASNDERMRYSRIFRRGFKAGAKWQKEQDDRLVDIIYQQGIEKGKDEMKETLKGMEK